MTCQSQSTSAVKVHEHASTQHEWLWTSKHLSFCRRCRAVCQPFCSLANKLRVICCKWVARSDQSIRQTLHQWSVRTSRMIPILPVRTADLSRTVWEVLMSSYLTIYCPTYACPVQSSVSTIYFFTTLQSQMLHIRATFLRITIHTYLTVTTLYAWVELSKV